MIEDSGERPAIVNEFIAPLQKPFHTPKIYQKQPKTRSRVNVDARFAPGAFGALLTPARDRIMQTPNNNITPILQNTSMHSAAPPLSGYNTTGDLSVANRWLSPGTPFVAHEYPSALFPTESDAQFVSQRRATKKTKFNPQQSFEDSSNEMRAFMKADTASAGNRRRRSSVETVRPAFGGMRTSFLPTTPTTPSNNYIQF